MITSSRSGFSLARWEEDEELGKIEPLKEPFPKPATNIEVGAEPLQPSAWTAKFCWLEEALPVTIFEFNSSTRDIKSSIRSLSVEICSQSWLMTPYKKEIEHLIKYSREELQSCFLYSTWLGTAAGESGVLPSYLPLLIASLVTLGNPLPKFHAKNQFKLEQSWFWNDKQHLKSFFHHI